MNVGKLKSELRETLHKLNAIASEAGGKPMGDAKFNEYRGLEDKLESLAGRITLATGEAYGPRIEPTMSRSERLEAWGEFEFVRGRDPGGLQDFALVGNGDYGSNGRGGAGPFRSLGDQVQAVVRAGVPGHAPDERLFQVRAATGMSEGVGSDGGFLVQQDFSRTIWRRMFETGRILSRVNRVPITSQAAGISHPYLKETARTAGNRYGGVQVYRKAEAATVSSSKAKLEQFSLNLETGMALVYLTDELIADAAQLDGFLKTVVPEAVQFSVEDEIFSGNGVGKCMGILNAPCLVTVAKESGQAAATIVSENVEKMFARLPAASVPTAAWFINQACWPQVFKLCHRFPNAAGNDFVGGSSMFMPSGGLAGAPLGTLLGLPIYSAEYNSALGTVGDIVLADFSQYVLIEKGGVDVQSSIHVQFIYGEQVLRFTYRNNGAPGYAWSEGPLTPYKGADTISPFITLATRA